MLRSAMMIQPNLARSSVMKMRRRRSSCSETRACATNLASFWRCWTDRERKIIFKRFGLDAGKPKTLEEVGKNFGVTRERIRQLQNIALAKLRRALAKREKPIVPRDPVQFLKPVSPDPTRTRLRVAKATIPPKATLHLILESSASDM